jgi:hypothetical protein
MSFEGVRGRLRHWRTRLPKDTDLRDTNTYELVDRFFFSLKPLFPVDLEATPPRLNFQETFSCVLATASGLRPEGCELPDLPYDQPFDDGVITYPAAPSGYVLKSHPLLREIPGGIVAATFDERVVLESRSIANTSASLYIADQCDFPNAVTQETYYFTGAGENQQLVATSCFQDTVVRTDWLRANQTSANLVAASKGRAYGQFYVQALQVELATGLWAGTTDVWVRVLDDGRSIVDTTDFTAHIAEISLFKARRSRRAAPQLL